MPIEKHDLNHEFPEYHDEIHQLKMHDQHFAKLFDEYHSKDHEVHRLELGNEVSADEYLEQLKKERLLLKDQLLRMLQQAS
jgi:uncharacterized protein YdcH (DUF465 family)